MILADPFTSPSNVTIALCEQNILIQCSYPAEHVSLVGWSWLRFQHETVSSPKRHDSLKRVSIQFVNTELDGHASISLFRCISTSIASGNYDGNVKIQTKIPWFEQIRFLLRDVGWFGKHWGGWSSYVWIRSDATYSYLYVVLDTTTQVSLIWYWSSMTAGRMTEGLPFQLT